VELRQDLARRDLALNLFSLTFGGIAALAEIGSGTLFTPYFRAAGMEPKLAIGTSAARPLDARLHQRSRVHRFGCRNPADSAPWRLRTGCRRESWQGYFRCSWC
jgi:hypothetical protein